MSTQSFPLDASALELEISSRIKIKKKQIICTVWWEKFITKSCRIFLNECKVLAQKAAVENA